MPRLLLAVLFTCRSALVIRLIAVVEVLLPETGSAVLEVIDTALVMALLAIGRCRTAIASESRGPAYT